MKINQDELYRLIVEECLKEEGIVGEALSPEKADEFIAWIKGKSPKPEWLDRDYGPGSYRRKVHSGHISLPTFKFGRNVPVTLIDLGIVLVWACLITAIVV